MSHHVFIKTETASRNDFSHMYVFRKILFLWVSFKKSVLMHSEILHNVHCAHCIDAYMVYGIKSFILLMGPRSGHKIFYVFRFCSRIKDKRREQVRSTRYLR